MPLTRTTAGLILRDLFADLSAWDVYGFGAVFAADSTRPIYGAYPSSVMLLTHGTPGVDPDGGGIREPHPMMSGNLLSDLWYGAGDGGADAATAWTVQYATTTDGGATFAKHGPASGVTISPWAARDMLFAYQVGGAYHFDVMLAKTTGTNGIPGFDYGNTTYTSTSRGGPLTLVLDDTIPSRGASGSWNEHEAVTSCRFFDTESNVWRLLYSGGNGADSSYNFGGYSCATQTGTFTDDGFGAWLPSTVNLGGDLSGLLGAGENPKYLGKGLGSVHAILANTIFSGLPGGTGDLYYAPSIAGFRDSAAIYHVRSLVAGPGKIDGTDAISVVSPYYNADGTPYVDSTLAGFIPIAYGSSPSVPGEANSWQNLLQGQMEPLPDAVAFSADDSLPVPQMTSPCVNGDAIHEFLLEIMAGTTHNNQYLFRMTSDGTTAGMTGYILDWSVFDSTLYLYRIVAGTQSAVATHALPGRTIVPDAHNSWLARIKVVATGANIKVQVDGVQLIDATDATPILSGPKVGYRVYTSAGRFRNLHVRSSDVVTPSGLPAVASLILRGAGGIVLGTATADGSGNATLSHWHYPARSIAIDGVDYPIAGGIWGGDAFEFTPAPLTVTAAMPSGDWVVLGAIRDLLTLTGQFDLVALSGLPEDRGFAAVPTACVIQPAAWEDVDEWDDASGVSIPRRVSWTLTILVRDSDPEVRDETADRLSNLAQDTLDGVSLAGITLPPLTKLRRGVWSRPASAERRLVLSGEFTYLVAGFAGHDDTD